MNVNVLDFNALPLQKRIDCKRGNNILLRLQLALRDSEEAGYTAVDLSGVILKYSLFQGDKARATDVTVTPEPEGRFTLNIPAATMAACEVGNYVCEVKASFPAEHPRLPGIQKTLLSLTGNVSESIVS